MRFMPRKRTWNLNPDLGGCVAPRGLFGHSSVPPLTLLEIDDGLQELTFAEIGPERLRHPDLGVSDLPQKEVADPQLAAGPDEKIRIGLARRVQVALEHL